MADAILCVGGIYLIRNIVNGKVYVGSTWNLRKRINEHKRKLESGRHENDRLQKAFSKYGASNFEFTVIELAEARVHRLLREQHWMDLYRSADRDVGYNIYPIAGSPQGTKHTPESRQKMSAAQQRRGPASEVTRARISAALRGREKTTEWIERHRASLTGYRHTDEARANMGASRRGRKNSPEHIAKTAAAHRGMKRSDETRAKMAEASQRRWARVREEKECQNS